MYAAPAPAFTVPAQGKNPNIFCQGGSCTYVPLEPLPFLPEKYGPSSGSIGDWVTKGFRFLISAGAIVAVVMIVLGALTYMFSDVVGNKTKAIARIRNAMWGLVILVSSYLILYTINPELTSFNLNFQLLNNYDKSTHNTSSSSAAPQTNTANGIHYPPVSRNAFNPAYGYATDNLELQGDIFGANENKNKLQQFEDQCQTKGGAVKTTASDGINTSTYTCYVPQYQI